MGHCGDPSIQMQSGVQAIMHAGAKPCIGLNCSRPTRQPHLCINRTGTGTHSRCHARAHAPGSLVSCSGVLLLLASPAVRCVPTAVPHWCQLSAAAAAFVRGRKPCRCAHLRRDGGIGYCALRVIRTWLQPMPPRAANLSQPPPLRLFRLRLRPACCVCTGMWGAGGGGACSGKSEARPTLPGAIDRGESPHAFAPLSS